MYWPDLANDANSVLKHAVAVQTKCGSNRTGAIATVAAWLGVSPQIVKMRINDEVVGPPRNKQLVDRCWGFLDMVAQRERAWVESLAHEVEQNRLRLQPDHPLEGIMNAESHRTLAVRRAARGATHVAAARRALAEVDEVVRRAR